MRQDLTVSIKLIFKSSPDVVFFQTVNGSNPMQLFHIVSFFTLYLFHFVLIVYPYIGGLTFSSFLFIYT